MERPGRYQEDSYNRRERRYSGENYELTNNGRHFRTYCNVGDSTPNSNAHRSPSPTTSHRDTQYYNSSNSHYDNPYADPEDIVRNLEELDPKTMEFDRIVELMHPSFLSDYLGRILNFLKGRNSEICFPNIAPFKEAFLVKLVTDRDNLYCESFNNTCRSICQDILKVLDSNRNMYRWVHAYESGIVSKSVLVYQKMFLRTKKQDIRDSGLFKVPQSITTDRLSRSNSTIDLDDEVDYGRNSNDNHSSQLDDQDDLPYTGGDLSKRQRNYKALFDSVTHAFIMSSLHTIADFVEDETRTMLQFADMDSVQARFLKTVNIFPFKKPLYTLLGVGCADVLKRLRCGPRLRVCEGRARKRDKLRDVTIKKKPTKAAKNRSRERKKERSAASSRSVSRQSDHRPKGGDFKPRAMFLKALSVSTDSDDSADVTDKLDSVRSQESDVNSSAASKGQDDKRRGNNSRYSSTGIDWQPAVDDAPVAPVAERGRKAVRHGKLAAALAVPVEADKAMRMMKLMGWEGGALGARGEGITEPIMPALDIVSGAGLGHSPTRGTSKKRSATNTRDGRETRHTRTSVHFRRELLEAILDLLRRQDLDEKEIAYQSPICKKARAFTRLAIKALNARKNLGLNSDEEKDLICRILANLNCKTRLLLDAKISDDWRLVTVSKKATAHSNTTPSSRRKRKKNSSVHLEPEEPEDDAPDSRLSLSNCHVPDGDTVTAADIENLLKKLGRGKSRRALVALAYRIIFLKKLLSFVNSKELEQTISFQEILNSRQCKFIENMILMINKREKAGYSTRTENDLYADIKKKVDCYLKVKFTDSYRMMCLQKKYYTKRFINTSTAATRGGGEMAELCNNNNNKDDKNNRDYNDDDEEDLDEDFEKRIEDMIVLSDSDDSVVSLECDYEVLGDEKKVDRKRDKRNKTDHGDCDTIDLETSMPNDEDLIDWNESSDESDVNETDDGDAVDKDTVITVDDTIEIGDETFDVKDVSIDATETLDETLNNDNLKVTDVISEIVLSDSVSSESSKLVNNDVSDVQMIVDNDNLKPNDGNALNAVAENNVNEIPANKELVQKIKNLDIIKSGNELPIIIIESRSLATESRNGPAIEDIDVEFDNDKEIAAIDEYIGEISNTEADNCEIVRDVQIAIDEIDTIQTQKGETQDYNGENSAEVNVKDEYVSDLSPGSSKRSRTESESSEIQLPKKPKIQFENDRKYIAIACSSPDDVVSKETAAKIQEDILKTVEESKELPLLKCNGIVDGKLQYRCQDENTLQWLETYVLKLQINDSKFKVIDSSEDEIQNGNKIIKMAAKINSFVKENAKDVFKRIELFNSRVKTDDWVVLNEAACEDGYVFTIVVDYDSYKCIQRCNFSLPAVIDTVEFSRIWD